jgi:hypothetical protein
MCVIDALAFLAYAHTPLCHPDRQDEPGRKGFVAWVDEHMPNYGANQKIGLYKKSAILYRLRCGLVHALGYPADKRTPDTIPIEGWKYTHNHPEHHWATTEEQNVYCLNLESHLAEVTIGAYRFFQQLEDAERADPEKVAHILQENAPHISYVRVGGTYKQLNHFADIPFRTDGFSSEQARAPRAIMQYLDSDDVRPDHVEKLAKMIAALYGPEYSVLPAAASSTSGAVS